MENNGNICTNTMEFTTATQVEVNRKVNHIYLGSYYSRRHCSKKPRCQFLFAGGTAHSTTTWEGNMVKTFSPTRMAFLSMTLLILRFVLKYLSLYQICLSSSVPVLNCWLPPQALVWRNSVSKCRTPLFGGQFSSIFLTSIDSALGFAWFCKAPHFET